MGQTKSYAFFHFLIQQMAMYFELVLRMSGRVLSVGETTVREVGDTLAVECSGLHGQASDIIVCGRRRNWIGQKRRRGTITLKLHLPLSLTNDTPSLSQGKRGPFMAGWEMHFSPSVAISSQGNKSLLACQLSHLCSVLLENP